MNLKGKWLENHNFPLYFVMALIDNPSNNGKLNQDRPAVCKGEAFLS